MRLLLELLRYGLVASVFVAFMSWLASAMLFDELARWILWSGTLLPAFVFAGTILLRSIAEGERELVAAPDTFWLTHTKPLETRRRVATGLLVGAILCIGIVVYYGVTIERVARHHGYYDVERAFIEFPNVISTKIITAFGMMGYVLICFLVLLEEYHAVETLRTALARDKLFQEIQRSKTERP